MIDAYDPEARPCLCKPCDADAALESELCPTCEWFGCSPQAARCEE